MDNPELASPDDFASRFRKDDEAPQPPDPAPTAPPPVAAPSTFLGLLEQTLIAPVRPFHVFEEAARRPGPGFGTLAANAAVYAAAFFGLNLMHALIAYPRALDGYPPERIAVIGAGALIALLFSGFAAAGALHAVGLVCGGHGSFARSYQAVSTMSALLLMQSAALWLPPAAFLPAALSAVLAAAALEKLHEAKPLAARAACGVLAAVVIAGGWMAKRQVESAVAAFTAQPDAAAQGSAGGFATPTGAPPDLAAATAALQAALAAVQSVAPNTAAAPQASSLDLVAAPNGASGVSDGSEANDTGTPADGSPAPGPEQPLTPKQAQGVNQAGANMLGSVAAMLNQQMPNASPAQRAQLQQLSAMMAQVQGNMLSGRPMTPDQRKAFDAQMKQVTSQMKGFQGVRAAAPPPKKAAAPKDPP
jgi:hypothetical protein